LFQEERCRGSSDVHAKEANSIIEEITALESPGTLSAQNGRMLKDTLIIGYRNVKVILLEDVTNEVTNKLFFLKLRVANRASSH
jgi:hypothetical protein